MKIKNLSKIAISQLICLPIIAIACNKNEHIKENNLNIASNIKFDEQQEKKLVLDNNIFADETEKEKIIPVVEKLEISADIKKPQEVNTKEAITTPTNNQNTSLAPINITINNNINTKSTTLKTVFSVLGGITAAAGIGYALYWLFKDHDFKEKVFIEIETEIRKQFEEIQEVEETIKYEWEARTTQIRDYQSWYWLQNSNAIITRYRHSYKFNEKIDKVILEITKREKRKTIYEIVEKCITKYTNETNKKIKGYQKLLNEFKKWISQV